MQAQARRSSVYVFSIAAALMLGGCAAAPDSSRPFAPMPGLAYDPVPSLVRSNASATLEVSASIDPQMQVIWRGATGDNHAASRAHNGIWEAIRTDITQSGLFTSIVSPEQGGADYRVVIVCEQVVPSNITLRMKATLFNRAGQELFSRSAESPIGVKAEGTSRPALTLLRRPSFAGDMGPNAYSAGLILTGCTRVALSQLMQVLKAGLADNLRRIHAGPALAKLDTATLQELIVSSDPFPEFARARNHALVAAKTTQLPALLRGSKTADLTALVIKIEQTVLDLEHEAQLLNDRAQQVVASGGGNIDEQRGLALGYRERVEILKPILAQLKDEIANRNR